MNRNIREGLGQSIFNMVLLCGDTVTRLVLSGARATRQTERRIEIILRVLNNDAERLERNEVISPQRVLDHLQQAEEIRQQYITEAEAYRRRQQENLRRRQQEEANRMRIRPARGGETWIGRNAVNINFPNRLLNNVEPLTQNNYRTNRNYVEVHEKGKNFYFSFPNFLEWYKRNGTNPLTRRRVNNARKVKFVLTPNQKRNRAARVIQKAFRNRAKPAPLPRKG